MKMTNNTGTLVFKKEAIFTLLILTGIAFTAPVLFKQQLIAGTIVNAAIILGSAWLGIRDGLLIGILPSTIALAAGTLNPALAPMVPFIIAGNAILVLTFKWLGKTNYWLGLTAGALLKFGFLYGASSIATGLLLDEHLSKAITGAFSWPQLATAIMGGIIAYAVIKSPSLKKTV
jgi:hypothetical protein